MRSSRRSSNSSNNRRKPGRLNHSCYISISSLERGQEGMADLESRVRTTEQHISHIYEMLDAMATNQNRLDEALVTLTDAQIALHQHGRETDERIENMRQHGRELDQRIERLVSGIGELVREMRERRN